MVRCGVQYDVMQCGVNTCDDRLFSHLQRESDYLDHIHTLHLDEIHEVTREWRDMMDDFESETGKHM